MASPGIVGGMQLSSHLVKYASIVSSNCLRFLNFRGLPPFFCMAVPSISLTTAFNHLINHMIDLRSSRKRPLQNFPKIFQNSLLQGKHFEFRFSLSKPLPRADSTQSDRQVQDGPCCRAKIRSCSGCLDLVCMEVGWDPFSHSVPPPMVLPVNP